MTTAALLGIPRHAEAAWVSLSAALERMAEDGRRPVCTQAAEQWSPDARPAARLEAAEACMFCPVRECCAAFAEVNNEEGGVWGGVDRTGLSRTRREVAGRAA